MTDSLVNRADDNLALHSGWIQRQLSGMLCHDRLGAQVADSGLPCDTFNIVCRARIDPARVVKNVAAVINHFGTTGRPFSWWVGPNDHPRHLEQVLTDAGLSRAESELAMVVSLDDTRTVPRESGADVQVCQVRTETEIAQFADLLAENWNPPDQSVREFYRRAAALLLTPHSPVSLYLARLGDEVVGTAEVTLDSGVAGCYNVGTRAAHRGRGIASRLVAESLLDAMRRGATLGILQAAPGAESLYQRLGFRAFGRYTEFKPHVDL